MEDNYSIALQEVQRIRQFIVVRVANPVDIGCIIDMYPLKSPEDNPIHAVVVGEATYKDWLIQSEILNKYVKQDILPIHYRKYFYKVQTD